MNDSRESARLKEGRRTTFEGMLAAVLLAAVLAVLALPAQLSWQQAAALSSRTPIFQVMEPDFLQPKFASARAIHAINRVAGGLATFGGYDEFTSCVRHGGEVTIASVTRFCGNILPLLDVRFLARADKPPGKSFVYISEKFWDEAFGRSPEALGSTLSLHGFDYRIAGIACGTSSLLAKTDVWLPAQPRGIAGGSPSLRVIGGLRESLGWKEAQTRLIEAASVLSLELLQDFLAAPRFVPVDRGIYFGAPEREWIAQHFPALVRSKRSS